MARLRSKHLDYEVACIVARKAGCRSRKEYWDWHDRARPNNLPKHPNAYYHEWSTWGEFLGNNNSFEPKERMKARPYWEAVRWAQKAAKKDGVLTANKWLHYHEQGKVPDDIPKRPNQYYNEWQGWRVWLGTTTEGRIMSEREKVAVFALANDTYNPRNMFHVVVAKDGLVELKEKLQAGNMQAFAVYEFSVEEQKLAASLLERTATLQNDGTYITSNLHELLFEFDNALLKVDVSKVG